MEPPYRYHHLSRDSSFPLDVLFDMETGDPDDFLTLCLLCSHPHVKLRAVTITPGSVQQVGLVRKVLAHLDRYDVTVGARDEIYGKSCVSKFHETCVFPKGIVPAAPDGEGCDIMYETLQRYPSATIITGAPLGNLGALLRKYPDVRIHRWVAQGGFAGDNIVLPEHRLPKFAGKRYCNTYNFGGDIPSAQLALTCDNIQERILVSKNVCHGVEYNRVFHDELRSRMLGNAGLAFIHSVMSKYLAKKASKKLHDPLAACVAIDPGICLFAQVSLEVQPFAGKFKGWGSKWAEGSNTYISVCVDQARFRDVFMGCCNGHLSAHDELGESKPACVERPESRKKSIPAKRGRNRRV